MHAPRTGRGQIDTKFALAMAAIVMATTGAVTGTAIGATTVKYDGSHSYEIPRNALGGYLVEDPTVNAALPDHYPIKTPEGVFAVAELRDRGLYANARFAYPEAVFAPPLELTHIADPFADQSNEYGDAESSLYGPTATAVGHESRVTVTRARQGDVATTETTPAQAQSTTPPEPLFQVSG